jgi:hypothetical protein
MSFDKQMNVVSLSSKLYQLALPQNAQTSELFLETL